MAPRLPGPMKARTAGIRCEARSIPAFWRLLARSLRMVSGNSRRRSWLRASCRALCRSGVGIWREPLPDGPARASRPTTPAEWLATVNEQSGVGDRRDARQGGALRDRTGYGPQEGATGFDHAPPRVSRLSRLGVGGDPRPPHRRRRLAD